MLLIDVNNRNPPAFHRPRLIHRTGRVSLLVLAMAAVMVIGGIAVAGFGIIIILSAIREGKSGISPIC